MTKRQEHLSPAKEALRSREDYAADTLEEKFARIVHLEDQQFEFICQIEKDEAYGKNEQGEAMREWWMIINSILWMLTREKAQTGRLLEPFPAVALARLAHIAEDLGNGHLLPIVVDVSTQDAGRRWHRAQREDVAYAVLYIEAVDRGEIVDRRARTNVSERFGVSPQTVRNWIQKERDRIVVGIPRRRLSPEHLTERMQKAGERYRKFGPGNG